MNYLIEPTIEKHKTSDVAIVITAYCTEPDLKQKLHMTKKLCETFKNSPHPIVLASHSPIPVDIQNLVDIYIYDKDNSFYWNGIPKASQNPYMKWNDATGALNAYYGVAELKSVHNAINSLRKYSNVKSILKIAYDEAPNVNHHAIIERAKKTKKPAVLANLIEKHNWTKKLVDSGTAPAGSFGTHIFYCDIDFFQKTLSMEEITRYDTESVPWLEVIWYSSIKEKNLLNDVYIAEGYYNYMGEGIDQYNDSSSLESEIYPF